MQPFLLDIDECALNRDNCHDDSSCINNIGSFECVCKQGYTGDGVNCAGRTIKYSLRENIFPCVFEQEILFNVPS